MEDDPSLRLAELVEEQIQLLGEDPTRDGLIRTPVRVAKAWKELTHGYWQELDQVVNGALFDAPSGEPVIVKNIEFYSLCEHHLLPFFGKCHIAYVPTNKVIGLSKLPRIVEIYSRRFQVQERLTCEIAQAIEKVTKAQGVAVVMDAQHLCMQMRGIQKQDSTTRTSYMSGRFREENGARMEFLIALTKPDLKNVSDGI